MCCNTHVFEHAGRNRRFSVPVASHVSICCANNCDINVVTGSEHEAVVVQVVFPAEMVCSHQLTLQVCFCAVCAPESLFTQTRWHTGAKEHPLFLFRQLGAELKVAQQRQRGAEQAQSAAAELTVHIPERFCSLTVHDGASPNCTSPLIATQLGRGVVAKAGPLVASLWGTVSQPGTQFCCLGQSHAIGMLHGRLCTRMRPQRPACMDCNTPGTVCLHDVSPSRMCAKAFHVMQAATFQWPRSKRQRCVFTPGPATCLLAAFQPQRQRSLPVCASACHTCNVCSCCPAWWQAHSEHGLQGLLANFCIFVAAWASTLGAWAVLFQNPEILKR